MYRVRFYSTKKGSDEIMYLLVFDRDVFRVYEGWGIETFVHYDFYASGSGTYMHENSLKHFKKVEKAIFENEAKFRWEISIPHFNHIYGILREWYETGSFDLRDYYNVPWYDGGEKDEG